jgi:hypothetical protein
VIRGDARAAEPAGWPHVLVVGVGRSGTTLLQSMLAAHPALSLPPEFNFIRRYFPGRRLRDAHARGGVDAVVAILEGDALVQRLGLGLDAALAPLRSASSITEAQVYRALHEEYARGLGRPRTGDKDPRSIEYLDLVWSHCPECSVIHVIRDPRDVLVSKEAAAWSAGRPALSHILANTVQVQLGRRAGRRNPDRYQEVVYEHLLREPEEVLRRVCSGIGVDYDPAMLDFGSAGQRIVTPSEMSWKREALGPLLSGNSGQWRHGLAPWKAAVTESACREAFTIGGYDRNAAGGGLDVAGRVLGSGVRMAGALYRTARLLRNRWSLARAKPAS